MSHPPRLNQEQELNPLVPKVYLCTLLAFIIFKKPMVQAANTDLFNPLVPQTQTRECQNLPFPLQIRQSKARLKQVGGFSFLAPRH